MEDFEPERDVYLALPEKAFEQPLFQGRFVQKRLREEGAKLIIFNPLDNIITRWIEQ
jgi:hypothetical protein